MVKGKGLLFLPWGHVAPNFGTERDAHVDSACKDELAHGR